MQYTPYAREMMELMKQLISGSITNDVYKQKRAEIEKKYKQNTDKIAMNYDKTPYSDSNIPEFSNDSEMISFLEQLAYKDNPNMIEPDEIITKSKEKPQRRRIPCQTNTLS